jgi:hypothetical protein
MMKVYGTRYRTTNAEYGPGLDASSYAKPVRERELWII